MKATRIKLSNKHSLYQLCYLEGGGGTDKSVDLYDNVLYIDLSINSKTLGKEKGGSRIILPKVAMKCIINEPPLKQEWKTIPLTIGETQLVRIIERKCKHRFKKINLTKSCSKLELLPNKTNGFIIQVCCETKQLAQKVDQLWKQELENICKSCQDMEEDNEEKEEKDDVVSLDEFFISWKKYTINNTSSYHVKSWVDAKNRIMAGLYTSQDIKWLGYIIDLWFHAPIGVDVFMFEQMMDLVPSNHRQNPLWKVIESCLYNHLVHKITQPNL